MSTEIVPVAASSTVASTRDASLPVLVEHAGPAARFAWDEFFFAEHRNPHTHKAYAMAVRRFLAWCETQGVALPQVTPGLVGQYLTALGGSPAKRNQHLAALRGFFGRLVARHVVLLNPAASVRGEKEQVIEGKTPEITIDQARTLLRSIAVARKVKGKDGIEVEVPRVVGLRDRAVIATLAYTACRAGAVAGLCIGDLQDDGSQSVLRFREKGGKSREIPVRHDLDGFIRAYIEVAGIGGDGKDRPLFRAADGNDRGVTDRPLSGGKIAALVKRRLKDAGLPSRLSPHSFRVAAITDLLSQGVPLEDVQYLAGHAEPRTTGLYDRRQKRVTRNIVERISI